MQEFTFIIKDKNGLHARPAVAISSVSNITLDTYIEFKKDGSAKIYYPEGSKPVGYYTYNNNSKTILEKYGSSGLHLKNLVYPATINKGLDSYLKELSNPSKDFSLYNLSMPLKYISYIDEDFIKNYEENLKKIFPYNEITNLTQHKYDIKNIIKENITDKRLYDIIKFLLEHK